MVDATCFLSATTYDDDQRGAEGNGFTFMYNVTGVDPPTKTTASSSPTSTPSTLSTRRPTRKRQMATRPYSTAAYNSLFRADER